MAKKAADQVMLQWGVAGVLLVVIILASAFIIWHLAVANRDQRKEMTAANDAIRKEMAAANEALSTSFLKALKEEREACDARHASLIVSFEKRHESQRVSHEKEMESHYEMMKDWRKEILTESKAMRDVVQLWVGRMALAKATADNVETDTSKKKSGGAS